MRKCFVCGNDKKKELFDSSVTMPEPYPLKGEQKIVQCLTCGFVFGDSENSQEDYQHYYETLNKHKKRAADAAPLDKSYYEKIFNLLDLKDKNLSILDFGSGDLLMKSLLIEKGFKNAAAFDIDFTMDPESKYDVILSTHTFEHILDGDAVLKKLISHLKDNGQLLLATPEFEGYLENYCGPYNWFDLEHINHFSQVSMKNFMKNKGLTVLTCTRDKREVRPGQFYPEVIIRAVKQVATQGGVSEKLGFDPSDKGLNGYLAKSEKDFKEGLQMLKSAIQNKDKVILRGLGITMARLIRNFDFRNYDVDIVDSNPRLQGKTIAGRKILSPEAMAAMPLDNAVIVVAAVNYNDIKRAIPQKLHDKVLTLMHYESN